MANNSVAVKISSFNGGLTIKGSVNNVEDVDILVDTGAEESIINYNLVRGVKIHKNNSTVLLAANNRPIHKIGTINIPLTFDDLTVYFTFSVVKDLLYDCVLGVDFGYEYGLHIDLSNDIVYIHKQKTVKRLSDTSNEKMHKKYHKWARLTEYKKNN